jgi:hypothetical protein
VSVPSHAAASPALGYLYQSQWPLLELLRGSWDRPDLSITLEIFDDVAWEDQGTATQLLQLKHHAKSARSLGDMSPDMWRTLRVWLDGVDVGDPSGPSLCLVTTQTAAPNGAAAALRPVESGERDVGQALRKLEVAAQDSIEKAGAETRSRFLALSTREREVFVGRIQVLDQAPMIADLDAAVRREVGRALPRSHEDTFMDLLWSWWHRRVLEMLQGTLRSVSGMDVDTHINTLRDGFTHDTLPTLVPIDAFDPASEADYADRPFVEQLRWVGTPPVVIQKSIIDYYRAYTQTAAWVEDNLIGSGELDVFEKKLRDEWDREFAYMAADLPADATDDDKRRAGQQLLRKTMDRTGIRVRERYDEPFFCRGKHHELADDGRVGWHPDFQDQIEALLLGAER